MDTQNVSLPSFRYLHDVDACWREEKPTACVVCEQVQPGYWFFRLHETYGAEYVVCETCLVQGRLAEKQLQINDGDFESVQEQLRTLHPEMPQEERDALAAARTAEVELSTPSPKIKNLFSWPAHCGDYCVFYHQIDAEGITELAPNGDGLAFLIPRLFDYKEGDEEAFLQDEWAENLRGFRVFYLWQCPQCREHLFTYTCE